MPLSLSLSLQYTFTNGLTLQLLAHRSHFARYQPRLRRQPSEAIEAIFSLLLQPRRPREVPAIERRLMAIRESLYYTRRHLITFTNSTKFFLSSGPRGNSQSRSRPSKFLSRRYSMALKINNLRLYLLADMVLNFSVPNDQPPESERASIKL